MSENLEKHWKTLSLLAMPKVRRQLLIKYIHLFEDLQKEGLGIRKYFSISDKYLLSHTKGSGVFQTFEAGSKFIRSYKGEQHEVKALKEGFLYRGNKYKSLSAIAREITGTQAFHP